MMEIFAETSFLFAIYREQDNSSVADKFVETLPYGSPLSPLVIFEFENSLRLQVALFKVNRSKGFPERLAEQAAYFGTTPEGVCRIGKEAKAFTTKNLSIAAFTVWTRLRDALGRSKLPRYYAMIAIGDKDLGEMLVGDGLARIYGTRVTLPDGGTSAIFRCPSGTVPDSGFPERHCA